MQGAFLHWARAMPCCCLTMGSNACRHAQRVLCRFGVDPGQALSMALREDRAYPECRAAPRRPGGRAPPPASPPFLSFPLHVEFNRIHRPAGGRHRTWRPGAAFPGGVRPGPWCWSRKTRRQPSPKRRLDWKTLAPERL
ncbi:MAG: hypothetical protein R3E96_08105 [Planctomycetota bacterium]